MNHRVVVTGMGVVAPNGVGLSDYTRALRAGESGIRHVPIMEELKFLAIENIFEEVRTSLLRGPGSTLGCRGGHRKWQWRSRHRR